MAKVSVYDIAAEDRGLAAWEIASVVASVLISEWVVFALAGDGARGLLFPVATVFAFMFLSHRARGESAREVGWRLDNFGRAARLLAGPILPVEEVQVGRGPDDADEDFLRWKGGTSIFGLPV